MLKVLVVEDEKLEREAMSKFLADNFSDIIVQIDIATNGQQALELFEKNMYQLVISDINMPKVTGLELFSEIRRLSSDTKLIVITGYNYFEYAQAAIRTGVSDFILKPVTQQELFKRINKIILDIQKNNKSENFSNSSQFKEIQTILKSDLIYAILYKDSEYQIKKYFSIFHLDVKSALCICLKRNVVDLSKVQLFVEILNNNFQCCMFEKYFENYVIYIFHDEILNETVYQQIHRIFDTISDSKILGIGRIKQDVELFFDSYIEALKDKPDDDYFDKHQLVGIISNQVDEIIKNLEAAKIIDYTELVEEMCRICSFYNENEIQDVLKEYLDIIKERLSLHQSIDIVEGVIDECLQQVTYVKNNEQFRESLTHALEEITAPIMAIKRKQMSKFVILAYEYIEKNYQLAIGLNDLADYLEVTPQYISSLLSQHTNSNFTNILAEYRISKAKKLLKEDKRIKEVAVLVGFRNQNYFTKTFKKITGYSPIEYKNIFGN